MLGTSSPKKFLLGTATSGQVASGVHARTCMAIHARGGGSLGLYLNEGQTWRRETRRRPPARASREIFFFPLFHDREGPREIFSCGRRRIEGGPVGPGSATCPRPRGIREGTSSTSGWAGPRSTDRAVARADVKRPLSDWQGRSGAHAGRVYYSLRIVRVAV